MIFETNDLKKKVLIENKLKEKGIDVLIRQDDINKRNTMDAAYIGNNLKPQYVYKFYVKRKQEDEASSIVQSVY